MSQKEQLKEVVEKTFDEPASDETAHSEDLETASGSAAEDAKRELQAAEEEKPKNATKKARQFDFESLLAQTIQNAPSGHLPKEGSIDRFENLQVSGQKDSEKGSTDGRHIVESHDAAASVRGHVRQAEVESDSDDDIGPALPPGFQVDKSVMVEKPKQADEAEEYEDFDRISTAVLIPTACEVSISHGSKPVTAFSFDQSGSKFATGALDYHVNLYEFQKMDSTMKAFRELTPCESHPIHCLAYSANGEDLVIASGDAIIKVLDRQGKQKSETVRGDQYLIDLSQTKGHTGTVNCVVWHPLLKTEFLSASVDGSLRVWSTEDHKEITRCINKQKKLIKVKGAHGKRANPTTCCYSRDGKLIAAGCYDGSILIWKNGNIFVNTAYANREAHKGPITSLSFSPDGTRLLSRSLDGTLKMFALSNFKKPQLVASDLPNAFVETDCGWSPRGEVVFTGTSETSRTGDTGQLLFLDANTFEKVYQIDYAKAGCVRAFWHPRLNQIMASFSDGSLKLYYDPETSLRGALSCVNKPVKRSRQNELVREEFVLSPLALEMFQPRGEEGEEKEVTAWRIRKYLRQRDNQLRPEFRKPADLPNSKTATGPRIASGGTLHSYIAKEIGTSRNKDFLADTDVRSSILRHADEAEKDPQFITKAYQRTQPVPIFQKSAEEEADPDDEELTPVYKKPKLT
uniref:WD_REPEATS_REGION domain-containing protein n=1 Tax=Steinernema glaseri TaxID=37863 RepID=A0A1I7ZHU0_9BILA